MAKDGGINIQVRKITYCIGTLCIPKLLGVDWLYGVWLSVMVCLYDVVIDCGLIILTDW